MRVIQRHALSEVSEGNDIDRHLVRQMTVLSDISAFVTRLSRAMDVKSAAARPVAPHRQSLEVCVQKLEGDKRYRAGADELISQGRSCPTGRPCWKGVVPQMQRRSGIANRTEQAHASTVTPALSRAFGASAERFSHEAGAMLDNTRVMVDGKTYTIRILLITAVIQALYLRFYRYRYLVAMMVKPLGASVSNFSASRKAILASRLKRVGRNCRRPVGAATTRDAGRLREAVRYDPRRKRQYLARRDGNFYR